MQLWTIADFKKMKLPEIIDITQENNWIVLWLKGNARIKFKKW